MKMTVKVLLGMLILALIALVFSNFILKKEFEKIDKSDFYWNYDKISNEHFSHVKIDGGNFSGIAIEQSDSFAVKVWKHVVDYDNISYDTRVANDTLFINMALKGQYLNARNSFRYYNITLLRVFTPKLTSVSGVNANIEFIKMDQPSIEMNMKGKSVVTYQTNLLQLDRLKINASDSTHVMIDTNPEIKADGIFLLKYLDADITGNSSLQLGRGQVDSLDYVLTDSSSIFLSGRSINQMKKK